MPNKNKPLMQIVQSKAVFPNLFFHGGTPGNFSYPKENLSMKMFRGQNTKMQLVAHRDYSSIADCQTKTTFTFRRLFGIFHNISKFVRTYSTLLVEPLTELSRTLVGKHWFKVFLVCY